MAAELRSSRASSTYCFVSAVLTTMLLWTGPIDAQSVTAQALKAAFLYNFAKFPVREEVAFLVCDERLELRATAVVPQRKETQEDDRQDVPLVVGWFDRTAECNRRLEQFLVRVTMPPFWASTACVAFFVPALRFAIV
jgi:hypothetical protein